MTDKELEDAIYKIAKEVLQKRIRMPLSEVSTKSETMYITSAHLACIEAAKEAVAYYKIHQFNKEKKVTITRELIIE